MLGTIRVISDTHIGAWGAAWPNDLLPKRRLKHVTDSRHINSCIHILQKTWSKEKTDILILLGDLIDGPQPKNKGLEMYSVDPGEQVRAAVEVLAPFVDMAKKTIRISGTPYHDARNAELLAFDEHFRIKSMDVLNLQLGDGILNAAHHPCGGGAVYRGSALDRESLFSMVAAKEGKVPDCKWIIRGHKHYFLSQDSENKSVCACPCFKYPDFYAKKMNLWRFQPVFGGVSLVQDKRHHLGRRWLADLFAVKQDRVLTEKGI